MAQADFWDRNADKYAASAIGDPASYERKLELTRKYMRPEMEVLEFACGTGATAIRHAPHVRSYRALDGSRQMIGHALARPGAERVCFEVADVNSLELSDQSLDMALGLSILHLLPEPSATIAKIHAALRPGGYFVSSTVCMKTLWFMRPALWLGQVMGKVPALSWFSPDELRAMMREAGFEIVEDFQPGPRKALFLICRKV